MISGKAFDDLKAIYGRYEDHVVDLKAIYGRYEDHVVAVYESGGTLADRDIPGLHPNGPHDYDTMWVFDRSFAKEAFLKDMSEAKGFRIGGKFLDCWAYFRLEFDGPYMGRVRTNSFWHMYQAEDGPLFGEPVKLRDPLLDDRCRESFVRSAWLDGRRSVGWAEARREGCVGKKLYESLMALYVAENGGLHAFTDEQKANIVKAHAMSMPPDEAKALLDGLAERLRIEPKPKGR